MRIVGRCWLTRFSTDCWAKGWTQDGQDPVSTVQVRDSGRATTERHSRLGACGGEAGRHAAASWFRLCHRHSALFDTDAGGNTHDIRHLRDTGRRANPESVVPGAHSRHALVAGDTAG